MYENPDETSIMVCPYWEIIEIRIEIKRRTYLLLGFGCLKLQEWISKWFEKWAVGRRLFQLRCATMKVTKIWRNHSVDLMFTVIIKLTGRFRLIFSAFLKNLNCTKEKGKYAIRMIGTKNLICPFEIMNWKLELKLDTTESALNYKAFWQY